MRERIIVTLTTWSARIQNIPVVLDTIFAQTLPPDLVVLNVAFDLEIPNNVQEYLDNHSVEVFRCEDTKVYKKLIPTLKRYPNDCVISIDDDWLYPEGMIKDFVEIHNLCPDYPISGNRVVLFGMMCHCGCASLVQSRFFGEYLNHFSSELMENCTSDDIVYSYFCTKNGHPYIRTNEEYSINMKSYNSVDPYTEHYSLGDNICKSYYYLKDKYGDISLVDIILPFIYDEKQKNDIKICINDVVNRMIWEKEVSVRTSRAYCIGKIILKPMRIVKQLVSIFNK